MTASYVLPKCVHAIMEWAQAEYNQLTISNLALDRRTV